MNRYLKKQLIERDKRLYYDFLPDMEGIIEKPANKLAGIILYVCFALIATTIIWACCFRTDIVITASGNIDTVAPLVSAVYMSNGRLSEIYVNEGDHVEAGTVICRLDSSQYDIALQEYEYDLRIMQVQKDLYEMLYEKYRNGEISSLDINPSDYGDDEKIAEAILLENAMFIEGMKNQKDDEIISSVRERLYSITSTLNKLGSQIENTSNEIENLQNNLKNLEVMAPISGTVTFIEKLYIGKTVSAGNTVCYINEPNSEYVFNAYVSDKDITGLKIGDVVQLKLPAYDDTEYECINGNVTRISNIPLDISEHGVVYVVKITPEIVPKDIKPGMAGTIDIIVGTRTIMEYFLDPFEKVLDDSLEEL
jgi:adhesin transport system membrane fusion protein